MVIVHLQNKHSREPLCLILPYATAHRYCLTTRMNTNRLITSRKTGSQALQKSIQYQSATAMWHNHHPIGYCRQILLMHMICRSKPTGKVEYYLLKFLKILSIQLAINFWYESSFHLIQLLPLNTSKPWMRLKSKVRSNQFGTWV